MPKGKRTRANKSPRNEALPKEKKLTPLEQGEANYFQPLVQFSNTYGQLLKQSEQYHLVLSKLEERRTKIQKGDIKLPIMVQLTGNSFYSEYDKKVVLEDIDKQIASIKESLKGIRGQLEHRKDDYVDSAIKVKKFLEARFEGQKQSSIGGERIKGNKKDEEKIFEADFAELMKEVDGKPNPKFNPKTSENFEKAMQEAVKKNKEK